MTEAPRSGETLAAELRRYRTMVEHAVEGICVAQGETIRFANARCLALLGVSVQEVGQRPMIEYVHPQDRHIALGKRERRDNGEAVPPYEVRFLRADGSQSWVEIEGVVVEWDGAPGQLFFMKDTTERRALDEALKSVLEQREAILETATVGVTFLIGRRHQWLNRTMAELLGYEPAELLGQETRVHYANDQDFESIGARAYKAIGDTGRFSAEVQMKRKDGRLIWVQIDGTAVTQGGQQGTVWTYVDITQRKQAEQEMAKALEREREVGQLKTRLLSMASHEFRTPLAAILSSAELIGHYGDKIDPQEQRSIVADLVAAARRMQGMLEDMFTLGQAEAGAMKFQPQPVDVESLCRQVVAEVAAAQGDSHLLALEVAQGGRCNVDARLVHYILGNLLINACKYSPPGSKVVARVERMATSLQLDVTDQGIGISEHDLPQVFESFHRGINVGNRPGSGLGLAIVKRCVELHGGKVSAISTLGAGSTFSVNLPEAPTRDTRP